ASKRTPSSAAADSQSPILPLPSSPPWAPTTATLPILLLLYPTATGTPASSTWLQPRRCASARQSSAGPRAATVIQPVSRSARLEARSAPSGSSTRRGDAAGGNVRKIVSVYSVNPVAGSGSAGSPA